MDRTGADLLRRPVLVIASGFGSGYAPVAPGTVGTLVGVLFFLLLQPLHWSIYCGVLVGGFALGVAVCDRAITADDKDPSFVVWDEIIGYLATMFLLPMSWIWIVAGFLVFRLLDVLKPWPVSWADREVPGGLGIMLDDLIAGGIACAVLHLALLILSYSGLA